MNSGNVEFALFADLVFVIVGLAFLFFAKNIRRASLESKKNDKINRYNPMYWFLKSSWFVPGMRFMGLVLLVIGLIFFEQIYVHLLIVDST